MSENNKSALEEYRGKRDSVNEIGHFIESTGFVTEAFCFLVKGKTELKSVIAMFSVQ